MIHDVYKDNINFARSKLIRQKNPQQIFLRCGFLYLFDCYALRKISRFIDIASALDRREIGYKLERNDIERGHIFRQSTRHLYGDIRKLACVLSAVLTDERRNICATALDLTDIAEGLFKEIGLSCNGEHGSSRLDKRYRAVLEFAGGVCLRT